MIINATWIADIALGVMLVEIIAIFALYRVRVIGVLPVDLLLNVVSAAFLVLGLRFALTGAALATIGICVAGAGILHAASMAVRWRS